ncbi:hypothetical protein JCM3770_005347 [Rhodotorula araucariae]
MLSYWDSLRSYVDSGLSPLLWPPRTAPPRPTSPPPFPPLPSELVLRILSYTICAPSHTARRARAQRLKAYALFSRDCARWAVLELRRDVRLQSFEQAQWFAREVVRVRGCAWARGVRVLRLGTAGEEPPRSDGIWRAPRAGRVVGDLLRMCDTVQELWLTGLSGLELADLAPGKSLRRLWINEVRVQPRIDDSASLRFERLSTVYLKAVIFCGGSLDHFLHQSTLPALLHVEYHSVHQSLVGPARRPANPAIAATSDLDALTRNLRGLTAATSPSNLPPEIPSHPLLDLAPQLLTLTLGKHAPRSLAYSTLLAVLGRAEHLRGLSLPFGMFSHVRHLRDYTAAMAALRLTHDEGAHSPTGTWRDAAFDLVPDARGQPGGDVSHSALELLKRLPALEGGVVTVRAMSGPAGGKYPEGEFDVFLPSYYGEGGTTVLIDCEREQECDGVWKLGGERWRERRGLQ